MLPLFPRFIRLIFVDELGAGLDLAGLNARFEIDRFTYGKGKITIFNLSESTISKMLDRFTRVQVVAGYPQRFGTILDAQVNNVTIEKDGADKITTVYATEHLSGLEFGRVSRAWAPGVTLHQVITGVVAEFPGVTVSASGLAGIQNQTLTSGYAIRDSANRAMKGLATAFGFDWWLGPGGDFHGRTKGLPGTMTPIVISRETGMVGSPIVSSEASIEVRTLLDPRILPDTRILVQSAAPQISLGADALFSVSDIAQRVRSRDNVFRVQRVVNVGETRGQTWYTQAFGLRDV